eukprot:756694-Hanusia_phi.AAC.1
MGGVCSRSGALWSAAAAETKLWPSPISRRATVCQVRLGPAAAVICGLVLKFYMLSAARGR